MATCRWLKDHLGLRASYARNELPGFINNVVNGQKELRPNFGDLTNEVFIDEPFEKEIGLVALTLDWDLDWATVTSATSYSDISTEQRQDATVAFGKSRYCSSWARPASRLSMWVWTCKNSPRNCG